jgi:hypothetical protein
MKCKFSRYIFEKFSNIKFNENPSCGSRVAAYGRADRQQTWRSQRSLFTILRTHIKTLGDILQTFSPLNEGRVPTREVAVFLRFVEMIPMSVAKEA